MNLIDGAGGRVTEFSDLGRAWMLDGGQFQDAGKVLNIAPVASAVLGSGGGLAPRLCDFVDLAQDVINAQLGPGSGPSVRP